jgi:hypothetical protein
MNNVFTGQAYDCVGISVYANGSHYRLQLSVNSSIFITEIASENKWISEIMQGRKGRRAGIIYTDESNISEALLRIFLKERIDLLDVVIEKVSRHAERKVRIEVAGTLNTLLNP